MSDIALSMEHVYKKFRRGEVFNSLRDLLPALTGRMFRQTELNSKDRREFWALNDVSFEVRRGEAFGIIGHNGAGKSTALKVLGRIMKPTGGRVVVNGRLSALIEVSAGFHQDLTGRENIYLNGTILGMSRREIDAKLSQIVDFSGLSEFIDTPVKRYSSGMYARLGFSVAAHVDPEILLVDEVLSVGDLVFQQRCINLMHEIMRRGTTVLFVSHHLKSITELCGRTMYLARGQVKMIGETDQVVRSYLTDGQAGASDDVAREVFISRIQVRDEHGERSMFESGQKAWVEVEITANRAVERLAVVLDLLDHNLYEIFSTSTERLGEPTVSLQAGESFRCTFELTLNIAYGTFYLGTHIHRYDINKAYDSRTPAATIFVGTTLAVRGAVNCFPRLLDSSHSASSAVPETSAGSTR